MRRQHQLDREMFCIFFFAETGTSQESVDIPYGHI